MLNDLLPGTALPGHIIRAVLAHPHAVAIATDVEGEPVVFIFQGKTCAAQAKGLARLLPGHLLPANGDGSDRPRLGGFRVGKPLGCVALQGNLAQLFGHCAELILCEGKRGSIVRRKPVPCALHRLEIRQILPPNHLRALRLPAAYGMESRDDRLPIVYDRFADDRLTGLADFFIIGVELAAPFLPTLLLADKALVL